jgi:hypothetical protein
LKQVRHNEIQFMRNEIFRSIVAGAVDRSQAIDNVVEPTALNSMNSA